MIFYVKITGNFFRNTLKPPDIEKNKAPAFARYPQNIIMREIKIYCRTCHTLIHSCSIQEIAALYLSDYLMMRKEEKINSNMDTC